MFLPKTLSDFALDPKSKDPKYLQLKRILYAYITNLAPESEYLPFENDIAAHFKISRRTVRKALEDLKTEGLIQTAKKRGSRLIRDRLQVLQEEQAKEAKLTGRNVAVILPGSNDSNERTNELRWNFVNELETRLRLRDCTVIVYNLREDNWNTWNDTGKLLNALEEKSIEWAVVYNHGDLLQTGFLTRLVERRIKPVLFSLDLESIQKAMPFFCEGVDFITMNHGGGLAQTLENQSIKYDFIGYLVGTNHLGWAQSRINACACAAKRSGKPFRLFLERTTTNRHANITPACVAEFLATAKLYSHPLCIAGNDKMAAQILTNLRSLGINVPGEVQLLGYDNTAEDRSLNLSTFDFHPAGIAEACIDLLGLYLANRDRGLHLSTGRLLPPVFIPRATTQ